MRVPTDTIINVLHDSIRSALQSSAFADLRCSSRRRTCSCPPDLPPPCLVLHGNRISLIEVGAFTGMAALHTLTLFNNLVRAFPAALTLDGWCLAFIHCPQPFGLAADLRPFFALPFAVSVFGCSFWSCKLNDWKASMRTLHHTFPSTKKRSKNQILHRLELRLAGKSVRHIVG